MDILKFLKEARFVLLVVVRDSHLSFALKKKLAHATSLFKQGVRRFRLHVYQNYEISKNQTHGKCRLLLTARASSLQVA